MKSNQTLTIAQLAQQLRGPILILRQRTRIMLDAAQIRVGELQTVAAHIKQQALFRANTRSAANRVYAFGAIVEREGYLDLDDYAIAGLEHNGLHYALWMALAAVANPASSRGELLRVIFSDPERERWCRAEGARVAWEFAKVAREQETALFHKRQAAGGSKDWRKEPVTARQHYLQTLISIRAGIPIPAKQSCGAAHDWIALNGGHPDFWTPPAGHPAWEPTHD